MNLLDKLKQAISDQGQTEIVVPEWDETFYVTPLTMEELAKLHKRFPNFLTEFSPESAVELIMLKAKDKDGNKAFTLEHKPFLLGQKVSVMMHFYGVLVGSAIGEDHEKN